MPVDLSLYLAFVMTSTFTVASPGPGVLMTIMKSIQHAYKGAIWTICGTATGALIMAAISVTGVGLLLRANPDMYMVLRLVGAAYMIFLGVKNWQVKGKSIESAIRQRQKLKNERDAPTGIRPVHFFLEGIMLQMTNPMLIMFFVSLFPQFVNPSMPTTPQYILLSMTYFGLILLIHSGYSLVTTAFRGFLSNDRVNTWIYRIGGSIFILLAIKVLWDVWSSVMA